MPQAAANNDLVPRETYWPRLVQLTEQCHKGGCVMPTGAVTLAIVAVLIYFGLAHRVLDRMRMTDKVALGFIVAMILGSFIDVTLIRRPVELMVNIGGGLLPLILAVYLVVTADTPREQIRGTVAALVSAAAVFAAAKVLDVGPEGREFVLDPLYVFPIIAGVVAYLAGRSRRGAFVAGVSAIVLADLANFVELSIRGVPGRVFIGGAGAFDSTVIAGLLAVLLAEFVGESRERLQGGHKPRGERGGGGEERGSGKDLADMFGGVPDNNDSEEGGGI